MSDPGNPPLLSLTGLSDHVADVDDRLSLTLRKLDTAQRDVIYLGVGVVIVALAILAVGYFTYDNGLQAGNVDAREISSDIQRATEADRMRNAGCLVIEALRSSYSAQQRATYPGGPAAYDGLLKQLSDASGILKCGP